MSEEKPETKKIRAQPQEDPSIRGPILEHLTFGTNSKRTESKTEKKEEK